ncbi:MAG: hypothetical protein V1787_05040 [Candidatus Micrarchaeota archaeon]
MDLRRAAAPAAAIAVIALLFASGAGALPEQSDYPNWQVPDDNGTANNTNITGRMQMYVGYYGNVTMQVRNSTQLGNVMYNRSVTSGKLYFMKNGVSPPASFINATANSTADGVIGLTGFYSTVYHFDSRQDACGVANVSKLNTTDNRMTGLLSNTANTAYFFCTDIGSFFSSNGFGTISYEIIVAKTPAYMAYDIWFDLS